MVLIYPLDCPSPPAIVIGDKLRIGQAEYELKKDINDYTASPYGDWFLASNDLECPGAQARGSVM